MGLRLEHRFPHVRGKVHRRHEVNVVRALVLQLEHHLGKALGCDLEPETLLRYLVVLAEHAPQRASREEDRPGARLPRYGRLLPEVERAPCDPQRCRRTAETGAPGRPARMAPPRTQLAAVVHAKADFHPVLAYKKARMQCIRALVPNGGDEGIRTLGLCLAKAALSQLSYIPRAIRARSIVARTQVCVNPKSRTFFSSHSRQEKVAPCGCEMNPPLSGGCPRRLFQLPQQRRMPVLGTICGLPQNACRFTQLCPQGNDTYDYTGPLPKKQS